MAIKDFFKKACSDMRESTRAQHQVGKAQLEAVKAESKAQWEEAKLTPAGRQAMMREEREAQITAAQERIEKAKARQK